MAKKKFTYNDKKYQEWRTKVYRRDRFMCQLCGTRGNINAHHIKRKADKPSLVYETDNGITLCIKCHDVVTGREKIFEPLFSKIVHKVLTLDYVYTFFSNLVEEYPTIVTELKKAGKWLLIPVALGKKIKQIRQRSRSKNGKSTVPRSV